MADDNAHDVMTALLYGVGTSCLILPALGTVTTANYLLTGPPTPAPGSPTAPVPLSARLCDVCTLAYFVLNLTLVCFIVDFEQLAIPDYYGSFKPAQDAWLASGKDPALDPYPVWPPRLMIDVVHMYARQFDVVLLARPPWWMATIVIDVFFFSVTYAVGLYAIVKGKDWFRIPAIMYSCVILTIMAVILAEETWGEHAAPAWGLVMLLNAPWVAMPALLLIRMLASPAPFSQPRSKTA